MSKRFFSTHLPYWKWVLTSTASQLKSWWPIKAKDSKMERLMWCIDPCLQHCIVMLYKHTHDAPNQTADAHSSEQHSWYWIVRCKSSSFLSPKSKSCGCLIDVHLLKRYKMIADFCCNPTHRGKTYQSGNDRATSPAPFMRTIDLLDQLFEVNFCGY